MPAKPTAGPFGRDTATLLNVRKPRALKGLPPMSKPERIVVGVIIAIPFFVLIGALAVTALNRL
jgi:hypothetical protein